jgi:hypothetical protein
MSEDNRLLVIQEYREGEWRNVAERDADEEAYAVCTGIQMRFGWWRIIEYPNGRGQYPINLYDELVFEVGGMERRAGWKP